MYIYICFFLYILLTFCFHADKDPEVISSLGLFKMFCKEVWTAALPVEFRTPGCLPLGTLARGMAEHLGANNNPPFCFTKPINGSISALHRVVYLAGWDFSSPLVMVSKDGTQQHLASKCPKQIVAKFKKDLLETIARRDIVSLHMRNPTEESQAILDNGLFLQPLAALAGRLGRSDAHTLHNIVSNGIFTNTNLVAYGYDLDPICQIVSRVSIQFFIGVTPVQPLSPGQGRR